MAERWIQSAREEMERKGTVGSFGAATPSKIAAAKKRGGKAKKRAVFAENLRKIAVRRKRHGKRGTKRG